MPRILSLVISTVFHPVFVNLLGLLGLFFLFPALNAGLPERLKWFYIGFIFISTSILPMVLVLVLKLTGRVESMLLKNKTKRTLPYIVTASLYLFCYYNFSQSGIPPLVLGYLLAITTVILLVALINLFYKISIHTATLGALVAMLCVCCMQTGLDLRVTISLLFFLSGMVASARLGVDAHTHRQVYAGFVTGFLPVYFIL